MHPILFKFHTVTVYSYGFFVALGMLLVFYLVIARAPRLGLPKDVASDLVFLLFVTGVIGARIFYVWQHFEEYRPDLLQAFSVQEGGLVWYGGFIVAVMSGLIYASVKKLPIGVWLDFFTPLVPLAHAMGRIGCFLNGCCFGKFTQSRWGILLPGEGAARLPAQLYEAAFLLLLSGFLFILSYKKYRPGTLFMTYVASYSAGRFFLEFLRGDQTLFLSLSIPQWSSLFLFMASLILLMFLKKKPL